MSGRFIQRCPACHSVDLLSVGESHHVNVDGSVGSWRRVKCEGCKRIWQVEWNEEKVVKKTCIIKCSECDYTQKIDSPAQILNYWALHREKTGHNSMSSTVE